MNSPGKFEVPADCNPVSAEAAEQFDELWREKPGIGLHSWIEVAAEAEVRAGPTQVISVLPAAETVQGEM